MRTGVVLLVNSVVFSLGKKKRKEKHLADLEDLSCLLTYNCFRDFKDLLVLFGTGTI